MSPSASETQDEEIIPEDPKPLPSQVANLKGMELGENISSSRSQGTTSPAVSHPSYPSTPGSDEAHRIPPDLPTGLELPRGPVDMVRQQSTGSVAATVGTEYSPHPNAGPLENGFPFPNVRPLHSTNASSSEGLGMTIPPPTSSAQSYRDTPGERHVPVTVPSPLRNGNSNGDQMPATERPATVQRKTTSGKPTMLGAVGEKKSFFHKMFHPGQEKHEKEQRAAEAAKREKMHLDMPKQQQGANGFQSSGQNSPGPKTRDTMSPPLTPSTPPPGTDSEAASRAPSRSNSVKRKDDPHAQPPTDSSKPGMMRRLSQRSASHGSNHGDGGLKPVAVVGGQPVAVAQKQEVVAASGNKFTLKDLIGLGDGPKMSRRGSEKGSDRGSTKGSDYGDRDSTASLYKKYGICDKAAIGKGATAVVRLAHKWDRREEKLYAVKEFRKRRKNETEKDYVKKLTSEFCISSTLHHMNIVETVDLVQDEAHHWCEVMEYCPGGDLYAAIKKGGMSSGEVECTFKQILLGIQYLHGMGVAHRDIKPENLLLDGRGHVKITDFGVSDVFRMCWEKKTHLSKGLCGSEPYIAPELFEQKEYDARLVDVWAAAIVFYCMQFQELPWRVAKQADPTFATYLREYAHKPDANGHSPTPPPLNNLVPRECRSVIRHMLDPDPKTRWTIDEVLKDKWLASVEVCKEGEVNGHSHTSAGLDIVKI